jgi:hypothetical protein
MVPSAESHPTGLQWHRLRGQSELPPRDAPRRRTVSQHFRTVRRACRPTRSALLALFACCCAPIAAPSHAHGQVVDPHAVRNPASEDSVAPPTPKRPALAFFETLGINVLVNLGNQAMSSTPEVFYVSPDTWASNLRQGWEWDENKFKTNQFEHPYHGSTYFSAGRSNGLAFWESSFLSMIGSLTWEYFGETKRPSLNDFINTTVGGMALGEMFHRTATRVRDNRATGTERVWREVSAFAIDPIGGFNRLLRGESGRIGPNPVLHRVPDVTVVLRAGVLGRESNPDRGATYESGAFAEFTMLYGDLIRSEMDRPFDIFRLRIEGSLADTARINRFQGEGMLYGTRLRWSDSIIHRFTVEQRFDYVTNNAYEFGGQSVEGRVSSRFEPGREHRITTSFGVLGTLLGAINSEGVDLGDRDYDFGPGLGLQLRAQWDRGGITYARWEYLNWVIPTLSGTDATHVVHVGGLELQASLQGRFAVGATASYFRRDSFHPDGSSFHQDTPEFRFYLAWGAW